MITLNNHTEDINILLSHGLRIIEVFEYAGSTAISQNLKLFAGKIEMELLLEKLSTKDLEAHVTELLALGANPNKLVSRIGKECLIEHIGELLQAGAKVKPTLGKLNTDDILLNLRTIIEAGAKGRQILPHISYIQTYGQASLLLDAGAPLRSVLGRVQRIDFLNQNLHVLLKEHPNIKIRNIVAELSRHEQLYCFEVLQKHKAALILKDLFDEVGEAEIEELADLFLQPDSEINPTLVARKMSAEQILQYRERLEKLGVKKQVIVDKLQADYIIEHYDELVTDEVRVNREWLLENCSKTRTFITDNFDILVKLGMKLGYLVAALGAADLPGRLPDLLAIASSPDELLSALSTIQLKDPAVAHFLADAGADTYALIEELPWVPALKQEFKYLVDECGASASHLVMKIPIDELPDWLDFLLDHQISRYVLLARVPASCILPVYRKINAMPDGRAFLDCLVFSKGVKDLLLTEQTISPDSDDYTESVANKIRLLRSYLIHG